jgi:hypothetical protein
VRTSEDEDVGREFEAGEEEVVDDVDVLDSDLGCVEEEFDCI